MSRPDHSLSAGDFAQHLAKLGFVGVACAAADPTGISSGILIGLSSGYIGDLIGSAGGALRQRFVNDLSEPNHNLQEAFARAVVRTLEDTAGGNPRKIFRKTVYSDEQQSISDSTLWNELHPGERDSVDKFFDRLEAALKNQAAALELTGGIDEETLKELIDSPESPELLARVHEAFAGNALEGLPELFQNWFLTYLNARIQAFFWEELKQPGEQGTPAWRAYVRMVQEEMRRSVQSLDEKQSEALEKLEALLAREPTDSGDAGDYEALLAGALESHHQSVAADLTGLLAVQRDDLAAEIRSAHSPIRDGQAAILLDLTHFSEETRAGLAAIAEAIERAHQGTRDHTEETVTAARKEIIGEFRTAAAELTAHPPEPPAEKIAQPFQTLPFKPLGELFAGREDLRAELLDTLTDSAAGTGRARALTQPHAVRGTGGIGKTALAVELGWQLYDEKRVDTVLFVSANTPEDLAANLAGLAARLDLPEKDATEQTVQLHAVLRWLAAPRNPTPWLLILDNIDTELARDAVYHLLPALAGPVLITSRLAHWDEESVAEAQLDKFTEAEARDYLVARLHKNRSPRPEQVAVLDELAAELDRHPLALRLAVAYIKTRHLAPGKALDEWRAESKPLLDFEHSSVQHRYPEPLARVWQSSVDQLDPPARKLLNILAWFAPEPFPVDFLALPKPVEGDAGSGDREEGKAHFDHRAALAQLETYSLLRWTDDGDEITIHRLVQEVTRSRFADSPEMAAQWRSAASAVLNRCLPNSEYDAEGWWTWEVLVPHLRSVCDWIETGPDSSEFDSRILNQFAQWFFNRAQFAEAEPLLGRALKIDEASFGPDHPDVAIRLNNLAQLLKATNRLEEAELLMWRALTIRKRSLGEEHPDYATSLNDLGSLLSGTNRGSEAEPMLRAVITIYESSFGSDHPWVATGLNNLALLLKATNRLEEAEPLMRRALEIDESSFGADNPDVAVRLGNLAKLLKATNRLDEAEPLIRRAVEIFRVTIGEDHPDYATGLNDLALFLSATNRNDEAEPMLRAVVKIYESSFGSDHHRVASGLGNLAQLLMATNRLEEAEPLMRRALEIDEASFGADHPVVATGLNNLAQLLKATNRLEEAEPLMRRALEIDEASFGVDHPNVANRLNNLAQLLKVTNLLEEAEPLMRRALEIDEASLGTDHPTVAIYLNNLAGLLQATNRLEEAEPLSRRHLEIFVTFTFRTGHQHPHLQAAIRNYTGFLKALELPEAEIQSRVAEILAPIQGGGDASD